MLLFWTKNIVVQEVHTVNGALSKKSVGRFSIYNLRKSNFLWKQKNAFIEEVKLYCSFVNNF